MHIHLDEPERAKSQSPPQTQWQLYHSPSLEWRLATHTSRRACLGCYLPCFTTNSTPFQLYMYTCTVKHRARHAKVAAKHTSCPLTHECLIRHRCNPGTGLVPGNQLPLSAAAACRRVSQECRFTCTSAVTAHAVVPQAMSTRLISQDQLLMRAQLVRSTAPYSSRPMAAPCRCDTGVTMV